MGVNGYQEVGYNGKNYQIPIFDTETPIMLRAYGLEPWEMPDQRHPILRLLNKPFDIEQFKIPRRPISLGRLAADYLPMFTRPNAPRVLDMPIKFPDNELYKIPRALGQFASAIATIINFERAINPQVGDYFAYLTIDQSVVQPHTLQREAPCHVDGFQGARWQPKVRGNHAYTVSDVLPTAYYPQLFNFDELDEAKHDFFWVMNAQVADTKEAYKWQPAEAEITMMDCYSVHRGVQADKLTQRTWLRLSYEERTRVFDRLGNAHNPLFEYDWKMVERDIEQLGLIAYRADADPSLNVFPWQNIDGTPLPKGALKTKPRLN
jgi:hypothetical protein